MVLRGGELGFGRREGYQKQKCLPTFPKYCAFLVWQLYDPQKVGFFKESHATLRPQSSRNSAPNTTWNNPFLRGIKQRRLGFWVLLEGKALSEKS